MNGLEFQCVIGLHARVADCFSYSASPISLCGDDGPSGRIPL